MEQKEVELRARLTGMGITGDAQDRAVAANADVARARSMTLAEAKEAVARARII